MQNHLTIKNIIIVFSIILLVIIAYVYQLNSKESNTEKEIVSNINNDEEKNIFEEFFVDVKGAVKKPGVYKLNNKNIINDAIKEAGGLTKNATTTNINLSKKLKSEMVIYIFTNTDLKKNKTEQKIIVPECKCENVVIDNCIKEVEENVEIIEEVIPDISIDENSSLNILININIASNNELQTLPGIGVSKAEAIINYRNNISLFKSIEDIKNVSGIGESVFNNIKDKITI